MQSKYVCQVCTVSIALGSECIYTYVYSIHVHMCNKVCVSIYYALQNSIDQFLEGVHLEQYLVLFNDEGYSKQEDIEHMIGMSRDDLRNMGITKRGVYLPGPCTSTSNHAPIQYMHTSLKHPHACTHTMHSHSHVYHPTSCHPGVPLPHSHPHTNYFSYLPS